MRLMHGKTILISTVVLVLFLSAVVAPSYAGRVFSSHLSGDEEVPPVITKAHGQVVLMVSKDGTMIHYILIAANIENVFMAHIHIAPAGVNGAIVVWLYGSPPPGPDEDLIPGRFSGVLAKGTFTAADLVGPLEGQPLSALISEIEAGNAYVNIHTTQFPGGEIRGQL